MKTQFEVGKTYRMRSGRIARVDKIETENPADPYPVRYIPMDDDDADGLNPEWVTPDGYFYGANSPHAWDLLLPAIGPELFSVEGGAQ
ncbi:MAG: hypothetical protein JWM59_2457 [Verrucomicrobiales bacterium]|nr:hypothetical protein [Verrucomicrobiales bacterium]